MRTLTQQGTAHAAARRHHWRPAPGRGFWLASRQEQPIRRRTLEAGLLGLPSLLLLPAPASAVPRAAGGGGGSSGGLSASPAASLDEPAGGSAGGRPGGRSTPGGSLLEARAQRDPSEVSEVEGRSDSEDDSGSDSDSSSCSSSSSSDEEGEQRRPAARRRAQKPEAGRQTEEQLRAQMKEDKRRAKEAEKAAKAARKEEQRARKEAEHGQAAAVAARGGDAAPLADARHAPSELPYPAAAGDAGLSSDEEGDKRQLSWLLGQLLQ